MQFLKKKGEKFRFFLDSKNFNLLWTQVMNFFLEKLCYTKNTSRAWFHRNLVGNFFCDFSKFFLFFLMFSGSAFCHSWTSIIYRHIYRGRRHAEKAHIHILGLGGVNWLVKLNKIMRVKKAFFWKYHWKYLSGEKPFFNKSEKTIFIKYLFIELNEIN